MLVHLQRTKVFLEYGLRELIHFVELAELQVLNDALPAEPVEDALRSVTLLDQVVHGLEGKRAY